MCHVVIAHIFHPGVTNWSVSVSWLEIKVFDRQACDSHSRLRRESWQGYSLLHRGSHGEFIKGSRDIHVLSARLPAAVRDIEGKKEGAHGTVHFICPTLYLKACLSKQILKKPLTVDMGRGLYLQFHFIASLACCCLELSYPCTRTIADVNAWILVFTENALNHYHYGL